MSQHNIKPLSKLLKDDFEQWYFKQEAESLLDLIPTHYATDGKYITIPDLSNAKIMAAKYAPGQQVEAHGKTGKVVSVHEEAFFAWGGDTYYEYVVELADGTTARLPESALSGEPLPTGAQNTPHRRLCECGAWAVPWAQDHHAAWCPESWRHR